MAIEAKTVLLKTLEQSLSTQITASDMEKVLFTVADKLEQFNIK